MEGDDTDFWREMDRCSAVSVPRDWSLFELPLYPRQQKLSDICYPVQDLPKGIEPKRDLERAIQLADQCQVDEVRARCSFMFSLAPEKLEYLQYRYEHLYAQLTRKLSRLRVSDAKATRLIAEMAEAWGQARWYYARSIQGQIQYLEAQSTPQISIEHLLDYLVFSTVMLDTEKIPSEDDIFHVFSLFDPHDTGWMLKQEVERAIRCFAGLFTNPEIDILIARMFFR